MRVTSKGQVTIPQSIRQRLGIGEGAEVDFVEKDGRVYLVKIPADGVRERPLRRYRGIAGAGMTTDEIMALTRGD
jgi:AbrB family looped-hinge helix DNA binding protein